MRRFVYITAALLFILLVLLVSGCSNGGSQNVTTTQIAGNSQSSGPSQSGGQQSSGAEQSAGQMIEPKQLISKDEAAQLIGEPVKDALIEEQPVLGLKLCFYAAEKTDSKSYLQIAVIQEGSLQTGGGTSGSNSSGSSGGSGSSDSSSQPSSSSSAGGGGENQLSTKAIFEALKKTMEDQNATDIGRIGDDTFITAQGICLLSKEYLIYVSAGHSDTTKVLQIIKAAGELAVSNLNRILGE